MDRAALIASLTAVHDEDGIADINGDGYIDWSTRLHDGGRGIEVGPADGGDAVQLDLSREQLLDFHRRLTLTLLRDAQG